MVLASHVGASDPVENGTDLWPAPWSTKASITPRLMRTFAPG